MENIKRIPIKEFREKGYLQELNRQFLHPLGLALEVIIEADGTEKLGGVWDYREDPEGIHYDLKNSSAERKKSFADKAMNIQNLKSDRGFERFEKLGFMIEPVFGPHN